MTPEHTRRFDLVPQEVHWICGWRGCQGEMQASGVCLPMYPPLYPRTCDSCGHAENATGKTYPCIEHRKA